MHPVTRIVLLIILALVSSVGTAPGQQAAGSPAKPTPAPTPIPLAKVPLEAQSALASLQEIDANVSGDQSSADGIARTLLDLANEIDAKERSNKRLSFFAELKVVVKTLPKLVERSRHDLIRVYFGIK